MSEDKESERKRIIRDATKRAFEQYDDVFRKLTEDEKKQRISDEANFGDSHIKKMTPEKRKP